MEGDWRKDGGEGEGSRASDSDARERKARELHYKHEQKLRNSPIYKVFVSFVNIGHGAHDVVGRHVVGGLRVGVHGRAVGRTSHVVHVVHEGRRLEGRRRRAAVRVPVHVGYGLHIRTATSVVPEPVVVLRENLVSATLLQNYNTPQTLNSFAEHFCITIRTLG